MSFSFLVVNLLYLWWKQSLCVPKYIQNQKPTKNQDSNNSGEPTRFWPPDSLISTPTSLHWSERWSIKEQLLLTYIHIWLYSKLAQTHTQRPASVSSYHTGSLKRNKFSVLKAEFCKAETSEKQAFVTEVNRAQLEKWPFGSWENITLS